MSNLSLDSMEIYYEDEGSGDPFVLVHGNYASSQWFNPLVNKMDGFRFVAPDLPCFGRSSKPDIDHKVSTYADYLDGIVMELGLERFHLLGHSLGGAIALQYSIENQRKVKKLFLVDPPSPKGMKISIIQKALFKIFKNSKFFIKSSLKNFVPESYDEFDEILEDALSMKDSAKEGHTKALEEFNVIDDLRDLDIPIFVFRGENDPIIKSEDLELYDDYVTEIISVKGVGHSPFLEDPESFIEHINELV